MFIYPRLLPCKECGVRCTTTRTCACASLTFCASACAPVSTTRMHHLQPSELHHVYVCVCVWVCDQCMYHTRCLCYLSHTAAMQRPCVSSVTGACDQRMYHTLPVSCIYVIYPILLPCKGILIHSVCVCDVPKTRRGPTEGRLIICCRPADDVCGTITTQHTHT